MLYSLGDIAIPEELLSQNHERLLQQLNKWNNEYKNCIQGHDITNVKL